MMNNIEQDIGEQETSNAQGCMNSVIIYSDFWILL